ncbi:MAG TPA: glycosyltransferase, partial [Oscillospiraceae bacterium]|nr:glycosyltransferase [Oscillospiraceae bacterium]
MKIAVAIPCYKVRKYVLEVIEQIPDSVQRIYAVDDKCPEASGQFVEENCTDPRVTVLYNSSNRGVGGAVLSAYRQALVDNMDIVVK